MKYIALFIGLFISVESFGSTFINCKIEGKILSFKKKWFTTNEYKIVLEPIKSERYGESWDICDEYLKKRIKFTKNLENPKYKAGDTVTIHYHYSDSDMGYNREQYYEFLN